MGGAVGKQAVSPAIKRSQFDRDEMDDDDFEALLDNFHGSLLAKELTKGGSKQGSRVGSRKRRQRTPGSAGSTPCYKKPTAAPSPRTSLLNDVEASMKRQQRVLTLARELHALRGVRAEALALGTVDMAVFDGNIAAMALALTKAQAGERRTGRRSARSHG